MISWAHTQRDWTQHQTDRWVTAVRRLAETLVEAGMNVRFDLWHQDSTATDFTRWSPYEVEHSDFTLLVVSKAWRERWQGLNDPAEGAGSAVEADTIKGLFQQDQAMFQCKHIVVLLDGVDEREVPPELSRLRRVRIDDISRWC
ncbi:SEFIR domain-containing protein [Amycolatopsis mediterranei]|uniref:SEFIR domain-containing protein n=1 Tax=Amycolatopsis mediterranei TaxID=33910 RepID=UPI003428B9CB